MPAKKYRVKLSGEEQEELKGLVSRGGRRTSRPMPGFSCLSMKAKRVGR